MSSAAEPCRTCDGLGFVETAAQNSRVIHYEPCPDCGGPFVASAPAPLCAALVAEYADVLERCGPWAEQGPEVGHPGDHALRLAVAAMALQRVAERLGVTDLHARAAARGERRKTEDGSTDRETDGAELS